jgi:argininosuccinate lyase
MEQKKHWSGRFERGTAKTVEDFTASIPFDWQLYAEDIQGSIAHARMLGSTGILSKSDAETLIKGLQAVRNDFGEGRVAWTTADEDIHMLVERLLREKVGNVAGMLHTARSRNDQVSTDLHLYVRSQLLAFGKSLLELQLSLIDEASRHTGTILPGYTHLQRAQPIVFGHHLLAYCEMIDRDIQRLQGIYTRVNQLPLGAGALAGTTFPIDRTMVARELGFDGVYRNSLDAVSDRDFIVEFLFAGSLVMMHLSRLCEEVILWSSSEFQFIELDDGYCTGSSIMPQKKNPDVAELVRGKSGRCYGSLFGLLTVLKGLPLAYNKDMQEDKEGLFDTVGTVLTSCCLMKEMIASWKVRSEKMEKATDEGFLNATEIADYLANKGMPFRDAHEVSGKAVRICIERGCTLGELPLSEFQALSSEIHDDIYSFLDMRQAVERRNSIGGTSPEQVAHQVSLFRKRHQQVFDWLHHTEANLQKACRVA